MLPDSSMSSQWFVESLLEIFNINKGSKLKDNITVLVRCRDGSTIAISLPVQGCATFECLYDSPSIQSMWVPWNYLELCHFIYTQISQDGQPQTIQQAFWGL